jgi:uncharacterized protein (TIGR03067 family)
MITCICMALTAVLAAAEPNKVAVEQELKNLSGSWEIVSLEIDGKERPLGELTQFRRVQQGDRVTWKNGDQTVMEIQFAINLEADPKAVDSTYLTGDNKGKTHLGIYRLEGDDFTMCFAGFDQPRPTEFTTAPASGRILYKAKRVEK